MRAGKALNMHTSYRPECQREQVGWYNLRSIKGMLGYSIDIRASLDIMILRGARLSLMADNGIPAMLRRAVQGMEYASG